MLSCAFLLLGNLKSKNLSKVIFCERVPSMRACVFMFNEGETAREHADAFGENTGVLLTHIFSHE